MMQIQEQTAMVAKDYHDTMKGKRGKRPRSDSPLALTMDTSSSSNANIGSGGGGFSTGSSDISDLTGSSDHHYMTLTSGEFKQGMEEEVEEDMANCLILLAKGRRQVSSPRFPASGNEAGAAEFYRCKTCYKSFSSFQALGGHRASHKKPIIKTLPTTAGDENPLAENKEKPVDRTILSLKIRSRSLALGGGTLNRPRVHECSICGAEFASGQALGGHMRRHRPLPPLENSSRSEPQEEKKPGKILSLDLNLPAPEELVFSATPLINCHY
ncbi:zinc finger protein ZAT5-like [Primulina huaijiensis]|uniref:zinc finger protein ZAT5-like n=1 Tax=Primulina huaijiensis TaxID=1492673 RepID=UPI003CC74376